MNSPFPQWASNVNEDGDRYYYKIGTEETVWDLPQVTRRSVSYVMV